MSNLEPGGINKSSFHSKGEQRFSERSSLEHNCTVRSSLDIRANKSELGG